MMYPIRVTLLPFCKYFIVLLFLQMGSFSYVQAADVELYGTSAVNLAPHVEIFVDPSNSMSPFDTLSPDHVDNWQSNDKETINRGYNQDVFWLRITLDAARSVHKEWSLVLANPLLEYIDLYQVFDEAGPRLIYRQGAGRAFDSRVEEHRFFIFPIEVYGPTTFLMRIEMSHSSVVPLKVYPSGEFWAPLLKGDIGNWLFFGIVLAMVIYNAFLYFTIRDKSYLFYVLFVLFFGILQLSLDGYLFQHFWWPDKGFDYRVNFWLTSASVIFAGFFIVNFLDLNHVSRRLSWLMFAVIGLQIVYFGLSFVLDSGLYSRLLVPNLIGFMLLAVGFGIYAWRKGMIAAKFFVLAWALFALGNILFLASRSGWLDLPFPPMFASKLGSVTETMLLAFALAYRIRLLRDDRERAQLRAEAQGYFLAQVSHEIRTPLNGILGMTEVLARTRLDNEQRNYIETIQGSGASLLTLINDILDYSKIEAGKMELHREAVNLKQLSEQQLQLFQAQADKKNIHLSLSIAPEVPEKVVIDAQRLRQILSNLISNAIKYTDRGSISIELTVLLVEGLPALECRIADTGIGISDDHQKELFKVYHQVDPSRPRPAGGTGLGLAICQQLVSLMGGSIHVRSEPDRGSQFIVRVPFEQTAIVEDTREVESPVPVKTMKILVAEDNVVNQKVIEGLLEKLGHLIEMVPNGSDAVARRTHPDFDCNVILMDCEMPEVDGYQATLRIREYERAHNKERVPIVALTAHALEEVRGKCIEAGMDDFLTKPINTRRLLRTLERFS